MTNIVIYTLQASQIALNTSYSIKPQSNGKIGEPQASIFVKIYQKSSKFPLACDFMAISGFVDSTTSLANGFLCTTYGLKHVIKYRTVIYWADWRATGTYFWPFQGLWAALQV